MTVIASRFIGRPVSAAPTSEVVAHDKWALVEDLTLAASDFDLSHRTIAVLRTMLTFLPERDLPALLGQSIVFASNETLASRLGGMPESTLRRHIAALVSAGIILRQDSPNRKRYTKRVRGQIACAFGLDVGPLVMMASELRSLASARIIRTEERAALHTAVLTARQRLHEALIQRNIDPEGIHDFSPLLGKARLLLRRKDNNEALSDLLSDFRTALKTLQTSASDSQNERHQHNKKNKNSNPEISVPQKLSADNFSEHPDLSDFTEYKKMYPHGASNWADLSRQVYELIPMMGIDMPVYEEAKRFLGHQIAPLVILCILERFEDLTNPGGYLRRLARNGRDQGFDITDLLSSISTKRSKIVS